MKRPKLPATVIGLGVVSLLTDASSEMIYPLMPLFLTTVLGAGLAEVGLIEGVAESTASLLKLVSGVISDRWKKRKPLVVAGYGLSAVIKPLFGLVGAAWQVLGLRMLERTGKGLRSGPRDALMADATPKEIRGRAYGLHRAMDNAGAVIGPLIAFVLMARGMGLRSVFLWSAVPALMAVAVLVGVVRERGSSASASGSATTATSTATSTRLPLGLRRYLVAVAVFALGNSSDAFLLIWARQVGVAQAHVPLLWMAHNAVKAVLSTPLSALSDRFGRKGIILLSWLVYAGVYLGFATQRSAGAAWVLLLAYGVYYALLEGTERALVADLAPATARGRAFGWYYGVVGVCALPASLIAGWLYGSAPPGQGATRAFGLGAALAAVAAGIFLTVPRPEK